MAETDDSTPPPPFIGAAATGDMVIVEVGPDRQRFQVYKEPLVYYSEYFRKALNGPWKEAEGVVHLDDVEPGIFKYFLQWLYTQDIRRIWDDCALIDEESCKVSWGKPRVQFGFIKFCVFADRFAIPKLQKDANNHLVNSTSDTSPWYDVVMYAFDNLPSTNRLLDFLVDTQCAKWDGDDDFEEEKELVAKLPVDFLIRVMKRHRDMLRVEDLAEFTRCNYHLHDSDEEKKACQKEGEKASLVEDV